MEKYLLDHLCIGKIITKTKIPIKQALSNNLYKKINPTPIWMGPSIMVAHQIANCEILLASTAIKLLILPTVSP